MRILSAFLVAALLGVTSPAAAGGNPVRFEEVPRVVATGDVHGDFHELTELLSRSEAPISRTRSSASSDG